MITVNLTAQGGINHGELTLVQLFTQLYHFWDVCWQTFQLASAFTALGINLISSECVFKQGKLSNCQSRHRRTAAVTKSTNKLAICFQDISSDLHICGEQTSSSRQNSNIMFYQDPFLLYQQTPFCHGSSPARSNQNRSSFRIDDILVPRQPFLVPKQPSFQESRSPAAPNANPLKFGMHSILTPRPREEVPMFQGILATQALFIL